MDPKVVVLLGPPGCGKGTQAARLSACLGIPAISTGEILRQECQSGSALGRAVQEVLQSGRLVDDGMMNRVVASRLRQFDCAKGFILDGYPRTAAQAGFLDRLLPRLGMPSPVAIEFFLPAEEIIKRLGARRQCPTCGRIFSLDGREASNAFCDQDGSKLVGREDDRREIILERLRIHERNSAEVTAYYRAGTYHQVSAARSPALICEDLLGLLAKDWPGALFSAHAAGGGQMASRV